MGAAGTLVLRRWRPDIVVGVGGYASGPVVLAARLLGIPTAVQEQNALPGFTNRVLGIFAQAAFTAFPEAGRHFARRKVYQLGNPIRRELALLVPFEGGRGEDFSWAERLRATGRVKTEHFIPEVMYHYWFRP